MRFFSESISTAGMKSIDLYRDSMLMQIIRHECNPNELSTSWKYFAPNIKIKSFHFIITYILLMEQLRYYYVLYLDIFYK